MAHNLNYNNGHHSFVSRKELPWHGLGKVVDVLTSEEAIKLGGLDFEVEKRPLWVQGGKHIPFEDCKNHDSIVRNKVENSAIYKPLHKLNGKFATVRTDNDYPLGIVGSDYEVIQNSEAFDFIDSIVGEKYAEYETAGALGNGEVIFVTCKLKADMVINKDQIDKYLLISMAHDGTGAITVMFTPIRVVCNNTLSLALTAKSNKVTIKHTRHARNKLELSKQILGIVDTQTLTYQEAFGSLLNIKVRDEVAKDVFEKVFKISRDEKGNLSSRGENIINAVNKYYHTGLGQEEHVGNGWGVYNAVTGYIQNVKSHRSADSKFKSTLLTNDVREATFKELISL